MEALRPASSADAQRRCRKVMVLGEVEWVAGYVKGIDQARSDRGTRQTAWSVLSRAFSTVESALEG